MPEIDLQYPIESGKTLPVTISVPKGKERDKEFIKKAALDYAKARYPNEFKDLDPKLAVKNPVTAPQGTGPGGQMIRPYNELGEPGYNSLVDPTIGSMYRGAISPITDQPWQGKAADAIEGLGTAATLGFAPEITANPLLALKSLAGGAVGGFAGSNIAKLANASPETQRLSGDIGNIIGGGVGLSPKLREGVVGALQGGARESLSPIGFGEGATGAYIGSKIGYPKVGAAIGVGTAGIKGAASGMKAGAAGKPWIDPAITDAFAPKDVGQPSPALLDTGSIKMHGVPPPQEQLSAGPSISQPAQLPPASSIQMPKAGTDFLEGYKSRRIAREKAAEAFEPSAKTPKLLLPAQSIQMPPAGQHAFEQLKPEIAQPATEVIKPETTAPEPKPPATAKDVINKLKVKKPGETNAEVQNKETKEAQPASEQSKESNKPEDKTTETQNAPTVLDSLAAAANPTWSPGEQITHEHLGKIADALGVNFTQLGNAMSEAGYDVQPSKFRPWGMSKLGKKDLTDIIDKLGDKKIKNIMSELSGEFTRP